MMNRIAIALALGALTLSPCALWAEDAALILVGDDYRRMRDVGGTAEARELAQMLAASGFRVVTSIDEDAGDAARAMEDFRTLADSADRVLVLISGHIVSTPREAWLLGHFADEPSDIGIGAEAAPLGPLFDIAAQHPGEAVVMVAPSQDAPRGAGLAAGLVLGAPQGVTLVQGPVGSVVDIARDVVLVPGGSLIGVAQDVTVSGFVSDAVPFLPPLPVAVTPPPAANDRDTTYWEAMKTRGDAAGYEAYLQAFPNGRYAALARAAIRELEADAAPRAEAALGLTNDARRKIQRDLSLLGYDPRGIDGIFGAGSRAAISAWQRAGGFDPTGYLTGDQVRTMSSAASVRAAELEREAEARKAEDERRDTAYWRETGRGADEAGLRSYLGRYPDGLFSDIAELRLAEIEAQKRAQAATEERAFWDQVRGNDQPQSYRNYLNRYPNGAFAEEAKARLAALTAEAGQAQAVAAAKAEEGQVAGNGVTRLLVENRLAAAGFDPGSVDGQFNQATRRAIRRFQRTNDIEVTGFVTRETMVRLLSLR
jgi:peptidoglycan hydrolase-like protein with peptidoglycan-binding domain